MVESVIETNDKEVGSHPCAVCASDPQGGPHSGCDEFQCSGCQKPEQFEAGFDEQDAIIQQAKADARTAANLQANTLMAHALDRLLEDIQHAECVEGCCEKCPIGWTNKVAFIKGTEIEVHGCMALIAKHLRAGFPLSREGQL